MTDDLDNVKETTPETTVTESEAPAIVVKKKPARKKSKKAKVFAPPMYNVPVEEVESPIPAAVEEVESPIPVAVKSHTGSKWWKENSSEFIRKGYGQRNIIQKAARAAGKSFDQANYVCAGPGTLEEKVLGLFD